MSYTDAERAYTLALVRKSGQELTQEQQEFLDNHYREDD